MPRRPQTTFTQFQQVLPQISTDAAAAPARAMANVGRELQGVGRDIAQWQEQMFRVENAKRESQQRTQWATTFASLQNELLTEPSPEVRRQKWADTLTQLEQSIPVDELSESSRDTLAIQFEQFKARSTIQIERDAALMEIEETKAAKLQERQLYLDNGQFDLAADVEQEMRDLNIASPTDILRFETERDNMSVQENVLDIVQNGPDQTVSDDLSANREAAMQYIDGLNKSEAYKEKLRATVRSTYRTNLRDRVDAVESAIAEGLVKSDEDLQKWTQGLPPTVYQAAKRQLGGDVLSPEEVNSLRMDIMRLDVGDLTPEQREQIYQNVTSQIALAPTELKPRLRQLLNQAIPLPGDESEVDIDFEPEARKWISNRLLNEAQKKEKGLFDDPTKSADNYDPKKDSFDPTALSEKEARIIGLQDFIETKMVEVAKKNEMDIDGENVDTLYGMVVRQYADEIKKRGFFMTEDKLDAFIQFHQKAAVVPQKFSEAAESFQNESFE